MTKNIFTKRNLKIAGIILGGVFAAFVVIVLILDQVYQYTQKRDQQKFIEELQKPYLEDTYGGKTPEETFTLFLEALKKEDIELASRYFMPGLPQEENKKYFKLLREKNVLSESYEKWSNALADGEKLQEGNGYSIRYKVKVEKTTTIIDYATNKKFSLPPGTYTNAIMFYRYPTGLWKIASL